MKDYYMKDVTDIYRGDCIHRILDFAFYQYLHSVNISRYQVVYFDGMKFFISLNTKRVYRKYCYCSAEVRQ